MSPTKFWLVWSPQGVAPPRHRHATLAAATNEAKRLAAMRPGCEFFVVEAVGCARKVDVEWADITEAEIPF